MTLSPFDPFILENGFMLLDGGLATELEAQGADLSSDLWSARLLDDNPSLIRETHLAYYRAGADVATSASYQASYEGFLRKGFDHKKATELLLLSVKLAVEARDLFWQEYQQQCASRQDVPPLPTPTLSPSSSSAARPLEQACPDEDPSKRQDGRETDARVPVLAPVPPAAPTAPAPTAPAPTPAPATTTKTATPATTTAAAAAAVAEEYPRSGCLEYVATRKKTTTDVTTMSTTDSSTALTTATMPTLAAAKTHQQQQQQRQMGWGGKRLRPLVAASVGCYGATLADGSEYRGDYGSTMGWIELKAVHKERLEVLAGAEGVDFLLFETVPCLAEVRAILSLLQDLRPSISAVISISCSDDDHLRSGELVRDFAELVRRHEQKPSGGGGGSSGEDPDGNAEKIAACVAIGVNCTDPDHVAGALRTLTAAIAESSGDGGTLSVAAATAAIGATVAAAAADPTAAAVAAASADSASDCGDDSAAMIQETTTPATVGNAAAAFATNERIKRTPRLLLVAYPNSGEVWDADARDWVEGTGLRGEVGGSDRGVGGVETFARMARDEWYTAGSAVRVFGGCCRTRPAHITEIRRALSALVSSQKRAALPL